MNTKQFNIEATYLRKSSYKGQVIKNETTLTNMQECKVEDKFVTFYYTESINDCDEGDPIALMIPVEDVINIKIYKR